MLKLYGWRGIFFADESVQPGGSFKGRALAALLAEREALGRPAGLVTFTSGNQGIMVCLLGMKLGLPCTVVVPRWVERQKLQLLAFLGANIVQGGDSASSCELAAREVAAGAGCVMIHPFRSLVQMVGYMTLWSDIATAFPDGVDVVVPVGSGSLFASGIEFRRLTNSKYRLIGVEPDQCASLGQSLGEGRPVSLKGRSSAAPSLNVNFVPEEWFSWVADAGECELVAVSDWQIDFASKILAAGNNAVDPGAAIAVAYVISGEMRRRYPQTLVIVTGRGGAYSRRMVIDHLKDSREAERWSEPLAPSLLGNVGPAIPCFRGLESLRGRLSRGEFGKCRLDTLRLDRLRRQHVRLSPSSAR